MKLYSVISILLLFQSCKQLQHAVEAYPTAAGHCSSGDLSGKFSPHGDTGRGPLTNGSLQVKFGSSVLQTGSTNTVNPNQQYTVTIAADSGLFFRGLLFRLSGTNGEDVEGTLSIGSDNNVQIKSGCADGISAVTHTNSNDKTRVSFNFEYTKSANADVLLEVTVVRQRAANSWYYSSYNLQIGNENGNVPTSSPTENRNVPTSPTSSPVVSQSSCYETSINTFILFISLITLVYHLR